MVKKLLVGFMMVVVMVGVGYAQTPMQRCFTFTGNVRANAPNTAGPIVASMGSGWVSQTPFYQQGVTGGMSVAYKICVNEDGLLANIESSTLYPVGGSGDPANGYPRPPVAFDHIYYNDQGVNTQILVGDPNEYIQIPFDPAHGSTVWEINDTFTIVHSAHILFDPQTRCGDISLYFLFRSKNLAFLNLTACWQSNCQFAIFEYRTPLPEHRALQRRSAS